MLQGVMFPPECDWSPPDLDQLPSWQSAKRIAIDTETRDPTLSTLGPGVRRHGKIVGVSFALEDGPAYYLPVAHSGGDNLPSEKVFHYLSTQARSYHGILVGANLGYDLDYLEEAGVTFPKVSWFRDIQVADPLIDELQMSYSLEAIAGRYDLAGKNEAQLKEAATTWGVHSKKGLWKLPGRYVAEYAIQDVLLPLKILRKQERIISDQDLWKIYDLESKVLPILVQMRRRGVRIDFDRLETIEKWTIQEEEKALAAVKHECGVGILTGEVWRPEPLARALAAIGVECPTTPKTGKPSVTTQLMESIDHPVGALLRRARKMNKIRTTFAASIRSHAIGDRIHCTFNQLRREKEDESGTEGAAYGRLSSCNPNIQQQPARDKEIGPMWRGIYRPDQGGIWACNDYSQQEPRWTVTYAEWTNCTRANIAGDAYRNNPLTDNHQMMADMAKIERKPAKDIFLGLCYSMGGAKLCRQLNLPTKQIFSSRLGKMIEVAGEKGAALLDKFDRMVPFVKELSRKCERAAKTRGYIITAGGRRCRFPRDEKGNFDWTYKALNRLIQGSSADQTKTALTEADAAGYPIQLQVHDELDLTVSEIKEAVCLAEIMRNCLKGTVPFRVDVECGPSWGEIKAV